MLGIGTCRHVHHTDAICQQSGDGSCLDIVHLRCVRGVVPAELQNRIHFAAKRGRGALRLSLSPAPPPGSGSPPRVHARRPAGDRGPSAAAPRAVGGAAGGGAAGAGRQRVRLPAGLGARAEWRGGGAVRLGGDQLRGRAAPGGKVVDGTRNPMCDVKRPAQYLCVSNPSPAPSPARLPPPRPWRRPSTPASGHRLAPRPWLRLGCWSLAGRRCR